MSRKEYVSKFAVYEIDKEYYILVFIGLGTVVGSICQLCCNRAKETSGTEGKQLIAGCPCKKMFTGLATAFLQLLLAPLIFGWIWSIQYGALMVRKANDRKHENEQSNP